MTTLNAAAPSTSNSPPTRKPASKKKPSLDKQAAQLANKMIAQLRSIKASGDGPFPIRVRDLAKRCGETNEALIKKSLGKQKEFANHTLVVISAQKKKYAKRRLDAFVCLTEDIPRLAATDELLRFVFELATSGNCRLFTLAELKVHVINSKGFQDTFRDTLTARVKDDSLPDDVGYLPKDARTICLFRLADIRPARSPALSAKPSPAESAGTSTEQLPAETPAFSPEPTPSPTLEKDFSAEFETAFTRLDKQGGSHNFVKLSQLRRALPEFDRQAFDRGIFQLRKARKFTANSSDGNYVQLSQEDREAGIREGDSLLVYISRL